VHHEVPLRDPVTDPIKAHVTGFGSALFDGAVGYASSAGVVGLDGDWGLRVAQVVQRGMQPRRLLAVASSASVADETTTFKIVHGTCTLLFSDGGLALGSMLVICWGAAELLKK
jgi:hypothetical protein